MRYLPLSQPERRKILDLCKVKHFDELITAIPKNLHVEGLLNIEPGKSELELLDYFASLAKKNTGAEMLSFLGQGIYDHSYPVVIDQLINRGEFLTAYTPYQPEVSQGTLQVIFEFQSMIAGLAGMPVANASLYDGSTALLEGVLMSARLLKKARGKVLVSDGLYPQAIEILKTYLTPLGFELVPWKLDEKTYLTSKASEPVGGDTEDLIACVMQSPNRFGLIEDWNILSEMATALKCKSLAHLSNPHALALFESPGECGVDMVSGEAQALGLAPGFGGPLLGIFACKKEYVRQMPGRLVGATIDARGDRAFCVTLSTREQHIRREKATSNICSNQNLMALRTTIYLALMGPVGLQKKAAHCRSLAYHARSEIKKILPSDVIVLDGEIFNEITLLVPPSKSSWLSKIISKAEAHKILAGIEIDGLQKGSKALSMAFTERHSKNDITKLLQVFE
jgi:glycine dehydrogenase subunit 1